MIDVNISNRWAGSVFALLLIGWSANTYRRFGLVLKREHLRDPQGWLTATPLSFLSRSKWTEAGVEFHKAFLRYSVASLTVLVAVFLILDSLF